MAVLKHISPQRVFRHSWLLGLCLLGCWSYSPAAQAAENVKIRFGFLEQSIPIQDLETFATTGRIPPSLKPLGRLLTPEMRQALRMKLPFAQALIPSERDTNNFLKSASSIPFLNTLTDALSSNSLKQLQSAFSKAARQTEGATVLSILKAYPGETIQVDATMAFSLLSQLNPSFLWTQALTPSLERDLAIATPTLKTTFDPTIPGTQPVERHVLSLTDRDRDRTFPVEIFTSRLTPAPGSPQAPLVVISHGLGADRTFLLYLAEHLASYGFTVAALEHPHSDSLWVQQATHKGLDLANVLPANEFIDRPLDISFLLNEISRLNQQPGQWQGKLPTQQVTVIGHSLGGTTALMLAGAKLDITAVQRACHNRIPLGQAPAEWLQCAAATLNLKHWPALRGSDGTVQVRDARIAQVIALNPMVGELFGEAGLQSVRTPVLMLASTDDTLTPALSQQFRPFQQLTTPKYLITAIGGTHLSVGDPSLSGSVAASGLTQERQGNEAEPLRRLMRGVALAFVQQLTPAALQYQQFLTPSYAQSLSQPNFPLRLSTELSSRLVN